MPDLRDELAELIMSKIGEADHPSNEPYVGDFNLGDGLVTIDGRINLLNLCDAILDWKLKRSNDNDVCLCNEGAEHNVRTHP